MSFKSHELNGGGSLGGRLVDVGDGVLRVCTKTGCYVHDAATALAKGRGIRVEELSAYQPTAAEKDAFCYLKYVMSVLPLSQLVVLVVVSVFVILTKLCTRRIACGSNSLMYPVKKGGGVDEVAKKIGELLAQPVGGLVALYYQHKTARAGEKPELKQFPTTAHVVTDPYAEARQQLEWTSSGGPLTSVVVPLDMCRVDDVDAAQKGRLLPPPQTSASRQKASGWCDSDSEQAVGSEEDADDYPSFYKSAQKKLRQSAAARGSVDGPRKSRFDEDREQLLCDLKRATAERRNDLIGEAAKGTKEDVLKEVERASKQLARARERRRLTAKLAAEAAAGGWTKAHPDTKQKVMRDAERLVAGSLVTKNRDSLDRMDELGSNDLRCWADTALRSNPLADEIACEAAKYSSRKSRGGPNAGWSPSQKKARAVDAMPTPFRRAPDASYVSSVRPKKQKARTTSFM